MTTTTDITEIAVFNKINQLCFEKILEMLPELVQRPLSKDDVYFVFGPKIYYPGGWEVGMMITQWHIIASRIWQLRCETNCDDDDGMASVADVALHLSTMSLAGPLCADTAQVFFESVRRFMAVYAPQNAETIAEMLSGPLDLDTNYDAKRLRRDIKRSIVKFAKKQKQQISSLD